MTESISQNKINSRSKSKLILILLTASFVIGYTLENIKKNHQLLVDARKLKSAISEPIEWVETISIHMGKKIVEHDNPNDLQFIDNLFKETQKMQGISTRMVSWSMFTWSGKKHKLLVNTLDGISKNPEDLRERPYSWRAGYNPWMLQITKTGRGMLSNMFVIPVAVGVANSRDEFQGSIITGMNAKDLLSRAEMSISSNNAFLLVNRDVFYTDPEKILLASANSPNVAKDYEKLPALVEQLKDWIDPFGSLPTSINAGRYKFSNYILIDGYQLAVLVGFDRIEFWKNVVALSMQIFIGTLLIYFLINQFVNSGKKSSESVD